MHEMSIAMAVVGQVEAAARRSGAHAALSVRLRVGELAGVVPDALAFSFELARVGTVAHGAELIVESVAARAHCGACDVGWTVGMPPDLRCPHCAGGGDTELVAGAELRIVDVCWAEESTEDVGRDRVGQEG